VSGQYFAVYLAFSTNVSRFTSHFNRTRQENTRNHDSAPNHDEEQQMPPEPLLPLVGDVFSIFIFPLAAAGVTVRLSRRWAFLASSFCGTD
jgi:hypothetical protein